MNNFICFHVVYFTLQLLLRTSYGTTNTTLYFKKGDTAKLTCPYKSTIFPIQWRGPEGSKVYTEGMVVQTVLPHHDRISVSGNQSDGKYDLNIHDFRQCDEGFYRCLSTEDGVIVHSDFIIQIYRSPTNISILNSTEEGTVTVYESRETTLICTVNSGNPPEALMWIADDKVLKNGGPGILEYTFTPLLSDHLRILSCSAVNNVTEHRPLSQITQLIVISVPVVNIQNSRTLDVMEGKSLQLTCAVKSHSQIKRITWHMRDLDLSDVSVNPVNKMLSLSVLKIPNLSKRDTGFLTCRAENEAGVSSDTVFLAVKYTPKVFSKANTQKFQFGTEIGKAAVILFVVESFEIPEVSWLLTRGGKQGIWNVYQTSTESGRKNVYNLSTTIVPLEHKHFGNYSLRIRNSAGKTDISCTIAYSDWHVKFDSNEIVLNTSDSKTLDCRNNPRNETEWNIKIKHFWNGFYIRTVPVKLNPGLASFSLNHVDYTDTGEYVCMLDIKDAEFRTTIKILVQGPPVISDTSMTLTDASLLIAAKVYLYPTVYGMIWMVNMNNTETVFDTGDQNVYTTTDNTTVSLTSYGTRVLISGMEILLSLPVSKRYENAMFSCRIRNTYGVAERTVDAGRLIRELTLETTDHSEKDKYLPIGITGSLLILLVTCITLLVRRRKLLYTMNQETVTRRSVSAVSVNDDHEDQTGAINLELETYRYSYVESEQNTINTYTRHSESEDGYLQIVSEYEDITTTDNVLSTENSHDNYTTLIKMNHLLIDQSRLAKSLGDLKSDSISERDTLTLRKSY